jgi:hypothetical protein
MNSVYEERVWSGGWSTGPSGDRAAGKFVWDERDGPRVAAILSIVETCRQLRIPAREYLAAVLPGLANLSIQRLPELTPTAWAASNR